MTVLKFENYKLINGGDPTTNTTTQDTGTTSISDTQEKHTNIVG